MDGASRRSTLDSLVILPQPESTLLYGLPRELRDLIWSFATSCSRDIQIKAPGKKFCYCESHVLLHPNDECCEAKMPLPALLNVSRQIRVEGTKIYYSNNTFRCAIHERSTMTPIYWLNSLSREERRSVAKIVIELCADPQQVSRHKEEIASIHQLGPGHLQGWMGRVVNAPPWTSGRTIYSFTDRSSWARFAEEMSLLDIDHSRISYLNGEKERPYHNWILSWLDMMEDFKATMLGER